MTGQPPPIHGKIMNAVGSVVCYYTGNTQYFITAFYIYNSLFTLDNTIPSLVPYYTPINRTGYGLVSHEIIYVAPNGTANTSLAGVWGLTKDSTGTPVLGDDLAMAKLRGNINSKSGCVDFSYRDGFHQTSAHWKKYRES
jgi:hypothetical protein